jgi:GT2 family glycosyltransferase
MTTPDPAPTFDADTSDRSQARDDAVDEGFFGSFDELPADLGPDLRGYERHRVTAVLVSHDGARWLPYVLEAIGRLARPPQRVLAVDTGSTDGSRELLADALGSAAVLEMPTSTGFGAAVRHAVDAVRGAPGLPSGDDERPEVEWVWLLHDDSAPEPETLRRLLAVVDASPSVALAGPKVRGWHDSSRLLEVGVSISGGGRRETGLERGELDQGQHDGRRDVLAVGSAGLLVRHDVWDELGGMDPELPLFRDDVDLGWRANRAGHRVVVVPEAVVHHVEAAAHGRRPIDAGGGGAHRLDRRSAVHVLLANSPAYSLPWHWLRLLLGSLVRTLGLLLGKAPREAADEILGSSAALFGVRRLWRARRRRAPTRRVPDRALRPLRPKATAGLRHGLDVVGGLLSGRTDLSAAGSELESGPVSDEAEQLVVGPGRVRVLLARPGVRLVLGLLVVALVAFRGLLLGPGLLQGGALLPAADGAADLWRSYAAGWHDVGVGSSTPSAPYLVPLASLATLLLGKPWLAVDLVLLLAVPLAGAVAYLLLGRLVHSTGVRIAGAVTYALLPALTGAVAGGRLGTAVAAWLLPLALWLGARALGLCSPGSLRKAWVAGLLLAVVAAFVPMAWLMAVLAGAGAVLLWAPGSLRTWLRLLAAAVVAPAVLVPWTGHLLTSRSTLLLEAGAPWPWPAVPAPPVWHVAVANPGGLGVPPGWVTLPLLLAGLAALLRRDRRRVVATAWVVVLAGMVVGLATVGRVVVPPSLESPVRVWPGTATLLVGGGLVAAAVVGAEGARERLSGYRFGWRQPAAAVLAVLSLAVPVALVVDWARQGVGGVLERGDSDLLPAYVQASAESSTRPRALVLKARADGLTAYALVPAEGRRIGDADVAPPAEATRRLNPAVSAVLAGAGGLPQIGVLRSYGIGYVVVDAPLDPRTEASLDGTPGLARVSAVESGAVWRVQPPGTRARLQRPPVPDVVVPVEPMSGGTVVDAQVPPTPRGTRPAGTLVLAEAADPGWQATGDGRVLVARTVDGWAQGFVLPAGVSSVTVAYLGDRTTWLIVEGAVLLVVAVLALPTRRPGADDEDDDDQADLPDTGARAAPPAVGEVPGEVPAGVVRS